MECPTIKLTMKTLSKILLLVAIAFTLVLGGCYYDNEDDLYLGMSVCDSTNVTYSASVAPVFSEFCNTCHSGGTPSGSISTDSYASVKANIARIQGAINHQTGYSQMPQGGSKLSGCDLGKIRNWVSQGMVNN